MEPDKSPVTRCLLSRHKSDCISLKWVFSRGKLLIKLVVLYYVFIDTTQFPTYTVTIWKPPKMLWTVNLCIVLFAGFSTDCVSAGEQCREERSINGMALQGFVFKKILVREFHECDINCEKETTCQSFNYVKGENSCELNNRTKEARPEHFRSDPARSYIRRLMRRGM